MLGSAKQAILNSTYATELSLVVVRKFAKSLQVSARTGLALQCGRGHTIKVHRDLSIKIQISEVQSREEVWM
jgi:hypothetical protein